MKLYSIAVPDAPTVQILPRYQHGRIPILIGLMTTFPTVVLIILFFYYYYYYYYHIIILQAPTFINGEIDGSIQNYTVTYYDSTFGSSCGSAIIQASSCVGGICTHNFDILRSSSCPPSTAITVSVIANNVLGSSPPSSPLFRGRQSAWICV